MKIVKWILWFIEDVFYGLFFFIGASCRLVVEVFHLLTNYIFLKEEE